MSISKQNGLLCLLLTFLFQSLKAQINLGSFNLNRGPNGDLLLGFGQGGSLFGFGGDRALQVTIGPGRFGANTGGGLTLNGDRLGVDSILGIDEHRGLNLGSFLNSGTPGWSAADKTERRAPPSLPANDGLGGFLHSIMRAFTPSSTVGRVPATSGELNGIDGEDGNSGARRQWPTSPPVWPTTPTTFEFTTLRTSVFPTLVPNGWNGRGSAESEGSGQWTSGVEESGFSVGPGSSHSSSHITTEGKRGPISSQRPTAEKSLLNSGEAITLSNQKKARLGPAPPEGMVDIDSDETKRRRS